MKDIRQTKHITALYERLSHDEDGPGESNSIQNQKKVLEQYAQQHGFRPIRHYTDDGISGGTFERPGWKRLIADVEAGEIGCVLVKDMSRIGRDYLQVGYYTEVFFPEKGVRFIAVSNAIDSQEQESGEFAPFLNVMSEYYLHDLSRKIRGAVEVKAQAGQHLSNRCPYGYRKDPEDGNHWLVDEEAAAVVLRIFHMALEGLSANTIAKRLSAEQIPTPRYYRFQHSGNICKRPEHPTTWSSKTVKDILSMPDYMGWTVNRKRRSDTYKDKARRTSPENWQIVRGTQDAIVDEALWNRVQAVRQEKKGPTPRRFPERHPLDGVVFCADCGAKLFHQREHGKGRRKPKERFLCSSHLYAAQRREKRCSRHSIATADLTALVLDSLRTVCGCALSDEAAFLDAVQKSAQTLSDDARKELRQRIRQSQRRSAELDRLIQGLYEGNVLGTVTDKRFALLSRQYEAEQAALEAEIAAAQELLTGWETVRQDGKRFVALARRFLDFSALTVELVSTFLQKILVHEAELVDGERVQEVELWFSFIGRFEAPVSSEGGAQG